MMIPSDEWKPWDGRPENPERDGWHWIEWGGGTGRFETVRWLPDGVPYDTGCYLLGGSNSLRTASYACDRWRYLGPCLLPSEHAALLAWGGVLRSRVEEAEAAAKASAAVLSAFAADCCTSGMSWSGMNIFGDKKSIKYVRAAVHHYEQIKEWQTGFDNRLATARREGAAEMREKAAQAISNLSTDDYYSTGERLAAEEMQGFSAFTIRNLPLPGDEVQQESIAMEIAEKREG